MTLPELIDALKKTNDLTPLRGEIRFYLLQAQETSERLRNENAHHVAVERENRELRAQLGGRPKKHVATNDAEERG